jgi:hypothetical protein
MRSLPREYVGGVGEVTALATVMRDRDNLPAMALCDKPSATLRRLVSAQSVVHVLLFTERFLVQFSTSVDDTRAI